MRPFFVTLILLTQLMTTSPGLALDMQATEEIILETEKYRSFFLSFPSTGENGQEGNLATAHYFKSKTSGKKKLVIILPIYGSSTYPQEIMSMHFTEWDNESDTNVLLLHGKEDLFDWDLLAQVKTQEEFLASIKRSVKTIKTVTADIERLIDWIATRPEIDPQRMGIIGFSIGAIIASNLMGLDNRISLGVFVMGGGNVHEIFSRSNAPFMKRLQKNAETLGVKKDALREILKPLLVPFEPLNRLRKINPDKILIFEAGLDDFIPKSSRNAFWEALGKPKRVILPYRHKTAFLFSMTILGFNYLDRAVAEFVRKKL